MTDSYTCEECRYFEEWESGKNEDEGNGCCHRLPPITRPIDEDEGHGWPVMGKNDWCGEFQEKKQ